MGYAPKAIQEMYNTIEARMPSAQNAGIHGHKPGYHSCRTNIQNQGWWSDYSIQKAPDKEGDPDAGAALDITPTKANDQYLMSQRLLNAKNDPRMYPIREFFGSTDGKKVVGWDFLGGYAVTSDTSHLWHIHISVLRKYANDTKALQGVADVITGVKSGSQPPSGGGTGDDDMPQIVQLGRNSTQNVKAQTDVEVQWNVQNSDPGNVFMGSGGPSKDQPQAARINLGKDGKAALYVSTVSLTIEGLNAGQVVQTRVIFSDMSGKNTGNSPWKGHVMDQNNKTLNIVDTRGYNCGKDKAIKIGIRAPKDVKITAAQWRVLYWK